MFLAIICDIKLKKNLLQKFSTFSYKENQLSLI